MLTTPFLTDIDPQAAIKGSRDPLGVQPIWARLGRHVVGNLTTASTSVRDFTALVLGYYFAERVTNEAPGDGDLGVFLRWEQLAAYARGGVNGDWTFRGVERARKNWDGGAKVRLGADSGAQILSKQKTYGLWGLYTVPARTSGLVEGDPARLTVAGRELVERCYLPLFTREGLRNADEVVKRLAKPRVDLDVGKGDQGFLKAVAKVLSKRLTPAEREIYRSHLLLGGATDRTGGEQTVVARAMESTFSDPNWELSPPGVKDLARQCRGRGEIGERAADHLERIRTAELLLAPSTALFSVILGSDGQTLAELARVVRQQWGSSLATVDVDATVSLEGELRDSTGEPETGQRWVQLARALAAGEYARALTLLLEQNAHVMRVRAGAAPWVDLRQGRLHVRLRDDTVLALPGREELRSYWRHSYFLDSLRTMAVALSA